MNTGLQAERVKRLIDECCCDACGRSVRVGDKVWIDLGTGEAFCTLPCGVAEQGLNMGKATGLGFSDALRVKVGDFLTIGGKLCRVEAVQLTGHKDAPLFKIEGDSGDQWSGAYVGWRSWLTCGAWWTVEMILAHAG